MESPLVDGAMPCFQRGFPIHEATTFRATFAVNQEFAGITDRQSTVAFLAGNWFWIRYRLSGRDRQTFSLRDDWWQFPPMISEDPTNFLR